MEQFAPPGDDPAALFPVGTASAHGGREVGAYEFTVGFLNEPVYVGQQSGVDLTICKGDCEYTVKDGTKIISNPALDAEKTLKAEVTMGAAKPLTLPFTARFGQPGKYAAFFTPTKEGDYAFRIFGTLDGKPVNETFVSSQDGFNGIEQATQYPPVQTEDAGTTALTKRLESLENTARTATTVGIAGIVVGILGLALAGFALTRHKRTAVVSADEAKLLADNLRG